MLMRSDRKVTAQGRGGEGGRCAPSSALSPQPCSVSAGHSLARAVGTSSAVLGAAGGGNLPIPQGLLHVRQLFMVLYLFIIWFLFLILLLS